MTYFEAIILNDSLGNQLRKNMNRNWLSNAKANGRIWPDVIDQISDVVYQVVDNTKEEIWNGSSN